MVSRFVTVFPVILLTSADSPPPLVPVLSNDATSPTAYPVPARLTVSLLTSPLVTESIFAVWTKISLDSEIKSLSEYLSPTLYGKVFLTRLEELKSKS